MGQSERCDRTTVCVLNRGHNGPCERSGGVTVVTTATAERDPMTDAYWLAERDERVLALEGALIDLIDAVHGLAGYVRRADGPAGGDRMSGVGRSEAQALAVESVRGWLTLNFGEFQGPTDAEEIVSIVERQLDLERRGEANDQAPLPASASAEDQPTPRGQSGV